MSFRFTSQVPQLIGEMRKRASALVRETLFVWESESKILAPVDTGFLRRTIQTAIETDLSGVIFVAAEYGVHVNYGTRRNAANPFFDGGRDAAAAFFEPGLKELFA
jgi:hypothetical protein